MERSLDVGRGKFVIVLPEDDRFLGIANDGRIVSEFQYTSRYASGVRVRSKLARRNVDPYGAALQVGL